MTQEVKLAPPGAGIPLLQRLMARYYLLPRTMRKTSEEQALRYFQSEGDKICAILRATDGPLLVERFLIPPMQGLEDSSRFWSIAMTVEHLIIVGNHMAEIVVALSQGHSPRVKVETAAVKPKGELAPAMVLPEFERFLAQFQARIAERAQPMDTEARLAHPWFGPYRAHQWLCLPSIHQRLHRKQIELIRQGVTKG